VAAVNFSKAEDANLTLLVQVQLAHLIEIQGLKRTKLLLQLLGGGAYRLNWLKMTKYAPSSKISRLLANVNFGRAGWRLKLWDLSSKKNGDR
jgi:hypothetical protein